MTELTVQLYSARETPLQTALEIIAAAGYKSVEAYDENLTDKAAFLTALKTNGLAVVSAHIGLEQLQTNLSATMELMSDIGASHIVCPYLSPESRPTTTQTWLQLADTLANIGEVLGRNGFTFAWHNHDFELEPLPDGSLPIQLLLDTATNMHWELDIGWVVRAESQPLEWLQKYPDRISAIHLKDIAATGECVEEDGWADVGHGIINWSDLLVDIKKTSASLFIVEHDNPSDLKRFVNNSFMSIQKWDW